MAQTTGANKGKRFVLKIETAPNVFTQIGGLRSNSMTINSQSIDVSSKDSNGFSAKIDAGVVSMTMSASGLFMNDTAAELLLTTALADQSTPQVFQLVNDDHDEIEGPFLITSYERSGDHDGAEMFSITLESAGEILRSAGT